MKNKRMGMSGMFRAGLAGGFLLLGCGTGSGPGVEPVATEGKPDGASVGSTEGQKRPWYCVLPFVFMCPWAETEQIVQVAFADDDSAHAFVKLMFKERPSAHPLNGTTDKKDFRHQVFIQDRDGENRRAVTGVVSSQNGATLYYMKRSGYLIVDTLEAPDKLRYDVIRLDGRIQTLETWSHPGQLCAGLEVVPSPDGLLIATVERLDSGQPADLPCAPGRVVVELHDAASLAVVARYDWEVGGLIESTWNPKGELIVHELEAGSWKLTRSEPPVAAADPRCIHPKTTSSIISSYGQLIVPGSSPQSPVEVLAVDDAVPFGCQ